MISANRTDNKELNKLRLVFEQTPGAIFILDKEFRFEFVNPSFEQLSGYAKEDLLGKTVKELFYHEEFHESRREVVEAMLKGEKWQGELLTHNKNGYKYWANTIAAPFCDEHGAVEGYIMIQQDITEKRRMQHAMEESEKFYRTLIESTMDPVSLNQDGKFLLVNAAFLKTFGYDHDELFAMNPADFIAPEDRDRVMDLHYKRMRGEIDKMSYTANFMHKSGERVLADLNATTVQVNGHNASFITMRDITQQNAMEKALRESETKYKTLVENSQDGILIVRNNKILYANDTLCNLLGYCPDGMTGEDIIHREDIYKITQIGIRRRNQDFSTINETFRLVAKNGEIKECDTTSTLIKFEGELCSFFTIHDLTENKRIQLELKESEEKYRLLFSAESDAIFMIDADSGQIIDVNPATSIMYGYTKEELLRMKNTDISAEPEKTSQATKNLETHVKFRLHKRKDGTTFPVELSAGFTKYKDKNIQIVTSRDISARIKSEEALAKSEQKYRELTEMLPLTVYELDVNNKPTYINKAGRELFGLNSENSGNNAMSFFVSDDRKRMEEVLKHEQEHAEIISRPESSDPAEYTIQKPDGTKIPVLIYGTAIIENNKPVGSRGVIVDISERKSMENALRKSEQKYRELADFLPQTVFELDAQANLMYVNKAGIEIMGVKPTDFGKSVLSFFIPEDHERMKNNLKATEREKRPNAMNEYLALKPNGGTFPVIIYALSVFKNKEVVGTRGIIVDISERKEMEMQLQTAKTELEKLNSQLEKRVKDSSKRLTETRTQLINLQKENLQTQYDVLKQQVNPHFLFNSLNVLTSLIKLEPDLAEKFSEQLSKVYRYVLENKDNELVDLNTELNFLDAYIFLLNIRFIDKLKVNIDIPINRRSDQIIPLAMQLLMENAIKHNTMSKLEPLLIDIFIDNDNNLNIVNNLQERPSQLVSTGVGLKNIQNRYQLLNNTKPVFEKTAHHFIAKVPLVIAQ